MNGLKRILYDSAVKTWLKKNNVYLERHVHVGPFSRIWAPSQITIKRYTYIGKYVTIEVNGSIGAGCLIANNVGIVGRHDHDFKTPGTPTHLGAWSGTDSSFWSRVDIGPDVWVGHGATILGPITIGHSSVIAAGSVVINDIEPFSIVAGNPAVLINKRFSTGIEREAHSAALIENGYL